MFNDKRYRKHHSKLREYEDYWRPPKWRGREWEKQSAYEDRIHGYEVKDLGNGPLEHEDPHNVGHDYKRRKRGEKEWEPVECKRGRYAHQTPAQKRMMQDCRKSGKKYKLKRRRW